MTRTRIAYGAASVVCLAAFVSAMVELYGRDTPPRQGLLLALTLVVAGAAVAIRWTGDKLWPDDTPKSDSH